MLRVLVVDDDVACLRLIGRLLALHGHVADQAATAREAFSLAAANVYDLVITDFMLGDTLGTAVLNVVRLYSPRAVRAIVTVHEDLPSLPRALVDEIVFKPFRATAIAGIVERAALRVSLSGRRSSA